LYYGVHGTSFPNNAMYYLKVICIQCTKLCVFKKKMRFIK